MATSSIRIVFWSSLFWIGALFAGFGMLFLVVGLEATRDEATWVRSATPAQGSVLGRDIRRASAGNKESTKYLLKYAFTTVDHAAVTNQREVSVEQWEAAHEGAPLTIYYLPARPGDSRLAPGGDWNAPIGFTTLGTIFTVLGGVLAGLRIRRWWLVANLERRGTSAQGTLTNLASGNYRVNGVAQWHLFYTFTDQSGQRRDGVSDWMPPQVARRWKKGATGTVRYDPHDPTRSIWAAAEPGGPEC
jgi:hypothetical protein